MDQSFLPFIAFPVIPSLNQVRITDLPVRGCAARPG